MSAKEFARIEEDIAIFGLKVHLGTDFGHERLWLQPGGPALTARAGDLPDNYRPALSISEEHARALMVALSNYFGGNVQDSRQLRRDYEAERARVDKFIDATITTVRASDARLNGGAR